VIRAPGHFDAVVDSTRSWRIRLTRITCAPSNDWRDHLHPSPAGFRAMAEGIALELFER